MKKKILLGLLTIFALFFVWIGLNVYFLRREAIRMLPIIEINTYNEGQGLIGTGRGFLIKDSDNNLYAMTATHVIEDIEDKDISRILGAFYFYREPAYYLFPGVSLVPVKTLWPQVYQSLRYLEPLYVNKDYDVSLLSFRLEPPRDIVGIDNGDQYFKEDFLTKSILEIGSPSGVGEKIYFLRGIEALEGEIVEISDKDIVFIMAHTDVSFIQSNGSTQTVIFSPRERAPVWGDSGSPILIKKKGNYKVVGILTDMLEIHFDKSGSKFRAVRVDKIINILEQELK